MILTSDDIAQFKFGWLAASVDNYTGTVLVEHVVRAMPPETRTAANYDKFVQTLRENNIPEHVITFPHSDDEAAAIIRAKYPHFEKAFRASQN